VLDALDALGEGADVDGGVDAGEPHPADRPGATDRPAGGDHRLRRDAVPEVGGAADHVPFDHDHLGAEPGSGRRCGVAGRTAADDQESRRHTSRVRCRPDEHAESPGTKVDSSASGAVGFDTVVGP
jgi:hypothetical protein